MKIVLILEKDYLTSELLAESLTILNHQPVIYDIGERFYDAVLRVKPDIIIINMGLYKRRQEIYRHTVQSCPQSTLILTSNSLIDPVTLNESGTRYFLHKPYDMADLDAVLLRIAGSTVITKEIEIRSSVDLE